jgi:hypothetical protein
MSRAGLRVAVVVVLGAMAVCAVVLVSCYDLKKSRFAMDTCGELEWVVQAVGSDTQLTNRTMDIAAFESGGHLVAVGYFSGSATFGSGDSTKITLTSTGKHDAYIACFTPAGDLEWVIKAGSTDCDHATSVSVLPDDAILVVGNYFNAPTFDADGPNETTLGFAGGTDIFVAVFESDGSLRWVERAGGSFEERTLAAAAGPESAPILLTGHFYEEASFGSGEQEVILNSSSSDETLFAAAYSMEGSLIWAKQANGNASGSSIETTPDNSVVVSGWFKNTAEFGPGEEDTLVAQGGTDIFIAKYAEIDGSLLWARSAGGVGEEEGTALTVLDDGSVVLTGVFEGEADFASDQSAVYELTAAGHQDIFVAGFDADDGTVLWARANGGTQVANSNDIAARATGGFMVTGDFTGTMTFGPGEPYETVLESAIDHDAFVAEYTSTGELVCARQDGGSAPVEGIAITIPATHSAVVTGSYEAPAVFGQGEGNETSLPHIGTENSYIMRLSLE